jgi:hypothetical protein
MMNTSYNMKELEQLLAVCTSTFYNMNGFEPDAEELCRQIGGEYSAAIYSLTGTPALADQSMAV